MDKLGKLLIVKRYFTRIMVNFTNYTILFIEMAIFIYFNKKNVLKNV
jgi:hypothetical protein